MTTTPDPLTVTFEVGLDTPISDRYVQTGEESWSGTPVTVLDAIIERAGRVLAQKTTAGDDYDHRRVIEHALKRVDEIVAEKVTPIVEAALEGTIQKTNQYGEATGKAVTLRELVIEAAQKQATSRKGDSFHRGDKTVLDEAVATTVKSVLTKELADTVAEAKAALQQAVSASAAEVLTDAIMKGVTR